MNELHALKEAFRANSSPAGGIDSPGKLGYTKWAALAHTGVHTPPSRSELLAPMGHPEQAEWRLAARCEGGANLKLKARRNVWVLMHRREGCEVERHVVTSHSNCPSPCYPSLDPWRGAPADRLIEG